MVIDTHVEVIDASRGIVGGYCIVWNQWSNSACGGEVQRDFIAPTGVYRAKRYPGTEIRLDHDDSDCCGFLKTIEARREGLYARAVLHDGPALLAVSLGEMFFSVAILPDLKSRTKSGWRLAGGVIKEISLTRTPAFDATRESREQQVEAAKLRAMLGWLPSPYSSQEG
jgi:hypothetical protein